MVVRSDPKNHLTMVSVTRSREPKKRVDLRPVVPVGLGSQAPPGNFFTRFGPKMLAGLQPSVTLGQLKVSRIP